MSDFRLTPDLISKLDKFAPSPEEVASDVYELLKIRCGDLDDYQLQCFAIQFLAAQALSGNLAYATAEIKKLNAIFYYAHYLRVSEACLAPADSGSNSNTIGPTLEIQRSGDFDQD